MNTGTLEHVNVTVSDPNRTADMLGRLFGWHRRWEGPAKAGGYTVHVGTDDAYVAVYRYAPGEAPALDSGRLWPRRSFVKRPGTITLSFGEEIPAGLPRAEAEARIHAAINRDPAA